MKFTETPFAGVIVIEVEPMTDERGWFGRTFCKNEFADAGFKDEFVQINHSFNHFKGTFRGLHFQLPPMHETKLIRCVGGGVLDIVVDLREGSPTFKKNFKVELSSTNNKMIFIPGGFAHGFLTLTDGASLIYHHTQFYDKNLERGLRHDDPALALHLPSPITMISERDKSYEFLKTDFSGLKVL